MSKVYITVNILITYSSLDKLILIGQLQNSVVKFCKMVLNYIDHFGNRFKWLS